MLSRLSVIARHNIEPHEELTITYVNPQLNVKQRQRELEEWGFGPCRCGRCQEELKNWKEPDNKMSDLAQELKDGLGVM